MKHLIAETLYDNTVFKTASSGSSIERSEASIAIEELAALLQLRDDMIPTESMNALVTFLEQTGIEYLQMYVISKKVSNVDTVYTLGNTTHKSTFDVSIEFDGDVIHVGILKDIKIKDDGDEESKRHETNCENP